MTRNQRLQHIEQLISNQAFAEARDELRGYLRDKPRDAHAWFLASYTVTDPAQQITMLQRAIEFDPGFVQASQRLHRLQAKPRRKRAARGWIAVGILALAGLGTLVIWAARLLLQPAEPASAVPTLFQPSLAALQVGAGTMEGNAEAAVPTETPLLPATTLPATQRVIMTVPGSESQPTPTPGQLIAADADTPTSTAPSLPATPAVPIASTPAPRVTLHSSPTNALVPDIPFPANPTAGPPVVSPTRRVFSPTATLAVSSTSTSNPPPGELENIVPLNRSAPIIDGELRIVSVEQLTSAANFGAGIVQPPRGQKWLVAELLVVCSKTPCVPPSSDIQVIDSAGTAYAVAPEFRSDSLFSSENMIDNQAWGYLGFLVPSHHQEFYLSLTQGGSRINFALQ